MVLSKAVSESDMSVHSTFASRYVWSSLPISLFLMTISMIPLIDTLLFLRGSANTRPLTLKLTAFFAFTAFISAICLMFHTFKLMTEATTPHLHQPTQSFQSLLNHFCNFALPDAGHALMLSGALIAISTVGNTTANAMHAFLGFLLWILGVTLLTLMPMARQFPQAARADVALASAVLKYFFAPWN